jgi:hypothetical protein
MSKQFTVIVSFYYFAQCFFALLLTLDGKKRLGLRPAFLSPVDKIDAWQTA